MSCPAVTQLAAVASGEGHALLVAHAAHCASCRAALAEQHEVRELVQGAPVPRALSVRERQALAAEVMARLDAADVARADSAPLAEGEAERVGRRRNVVAAITFTTAIAAAAAVVLVAVAGSSQPQLARTPDLSGVSAPVAKPQPAPTPRVPRAMPVTDIAGVTGAKAVFERETTAAHDRVRLRDGALEIDAVVARPIQIVTRTVEVLVPTQARASVVARKGVIESVAVFAGSVEVIVGARRHRVEAGAVWERATIIASSASAPQPAKAPVEATPTTPVVPVADDGSSLAAFRDGWTALRAGDHRTAIAAFDRATAAVVAEDAAYWAAIACERAGDRGDAARRYTAFIARFPGSPRVEAATLALARASQ